MTAAKAGLAEGAMKHPMRAPSGDKRGGKGWRNHHHSHSPSHSHSPNHAATQPHSHTATAKHNAMMQ